MSRSRFAILTAAVLVAGCQAPAAAPTGAVAGESQPLFGASLNTWAKLGADQQVSEVGFTMPLAIVEAAPTAGAPSLVRARFPEAVARSTFINHLTVDYNPEGHPPEKVYDKPHFDLHFYAMPAAEVDAIDCADQTLPATDAVPAGFALLPPGTGECVPKMGFHASSLASPELAPENPQPFNHTMILGYYGGKLNFVEPMVTREFLLTKQDFSYPVAKPASIGRATRYPTSFKATYDAEAKAYHFALSDFVQAE